MQHIVAWFPSDASTYLPTFYKHLLSFLDVYFTGFYLFTPQFISFSLWLHYFYVYGMFCWKELWGET